MTERDSIHRTGQGSHWQQSGTSHILINAIHWPCRPRSAPWWFDRVGNKLSLKANLAIYSYVLGISRYCKSVGLIISNKLGFISYAIRDGFRKSKYICMYVCMYVFIYTIVWENLTLNNFRHWWDMTKIKYMKYF